MSVNIQQRLAAQLQSLARVSLRLSATLLLDDVLDLVVNEAVSNTDACCGETVLFAYQNLGKSRFASNAPIPESTQFDEEAIRRKDTVTGTLEEHLEDDLSGMSVLIVPILFEDRVAGLLRLFKRNAHPFIEADQTFVSTLSHHAAVAVGNARRFQDLRERNTLLQQRTQQIEHFLESSRVLHSERRLEEVYEELVYGIQEGVGYNVVLLSLVEDGTHGLILKRMTAAGLPLDRVKQLQRIEQPWKDLEPLLLDEFRLGGAYFVPQKEADAVRRNLDIHQVGDLYPAAKTPMQTSSVREMWHEDDLFFIPLRDSQGKPLGLISLTAPIDGRRPDLDTARVLEVFANQAASAIENVRLFHSMWDYALQLQQLHNVSQQTLRERDFDRQLEYILDGLEIAGWRRVLLTLHDESLDVTKLATAGYGDDEREILEENLLPTEAWYQQFTDGRFQKYRRGNCFLLQGDDLTRRVDTALSLPDLAENDESWQAGAALYRPLYDRDEKLVGLLALALPENGRLIDENGLQTIDLYAQFAISVIESQRLFSEMQRRSQELQVLFDASRTLSGTVKQEAILGAMGEHMLRAVQASAFRIYALTRDRLSTTMVYSSSQMEAPSDVEFSNRSSLKRMELAKRVIDTERAAATQLSSATSEKERENTENTISLAILPIPLRDELFGLVEVVAANPRFNWTPDKLQLLEAIANQAGTALETAHLVEELDERVAKRTRALAEEVARVQSILESIADGVLVAESDGTILLANKPISKFLDVARARLIGRSVDELIGVYGPGADRWARIVRDWSSRAETLEPHSVVKDQFEIEDRVLSVHMSPVFADDQYFGTITTFRDMTREAEVDRMKSEFVSNVSHELRTPMTSIKGYTDLLFMGAAGELPSSQLRLLEAIRRNADRLKILVDDLLEISWVETGQSDLKRETISITRIIESDIGDHVRGRIQHETKSIDVTFDLDPDLPPVFVDREKITRVIMNLVDNAITYTPDGGEVTVRALARDEGQVAPTVEIQVSDTGVGIDSKHLERIFERFYRVEEGTIQENPGTGLGLSIVRSLVEMHGGEIHVESEPGAGSTFSISLPCADVQPEVDATNNSMTDSMTGALT